MGRRRIDKGKRKEESGYDLVTTYEIEKALNSELERMSLTPIQRKIVKAKKRENDITYQGALKSSAQRMLEGEMELEKGERMSVSDAIVSKQIEKAMIGDTKAFNSIVELVGEKKEVVEHRVTRVQEIADTVIDVEEY